MSSDPEASRSFECGTPLNSVLIPLPISALQATREIMAVLLTTGRISVAQFRNHIVSGYSKRSPETNANHKDTYCYFPADVHFHFSSWTATTDEPVLP